MTDDERRAYARGYSRGAKWPLHKPPLPPEPVLARFLTASRRLRDAVDTQLSHLDEDDPWQVTLGGPLDELDEAFKELGRWLKSMEADDSVVAEYFRVREGKVHTTQEFADGCAFADYNRDGELLGIEVIAVKAASEAAGEKP